MIYGVLYGSGEARIAACLNVSEQDARRMKRDFLSRFPGIQRFTMETIKSCRKLGYVETLLGRRRHIAGELFQQSMYIYIYINLPVTFVILTFCS